MSTPTVHRATIICTPAYREWLRARYQFSLDKRAVVASITSERIRSGVMRVRFAYAR